MLRNDRLSLPRVKRTDKLETATVRPQRAESSAFRTEVFQPCLSFLKALAFHFPWDTPYGGMGVGECIGGSGEEKKSSLLPGSWPSHLPSQADVWLLELLISYQQYSSFPYLSKTWLNKLQAQWKTHYRDEWNIQFLPPKELKAKGEIKQVRNISSTKTVWC